MIREAGVLLRGHPRLRAAAVGTGPKPIPGDGDPVIGPAPGVEGLHVAFTHSGATLGLIAGVLLASQVIGGDQPPLLAPFRPRPVRLSDRGTSGPVTPEAPAGLSSMTTTTRLTSVAVRVADQDRALAFYVDVLGCTLRTDVEFWPGARWVEVVPPGSPVSLVLLTEAGGMPIGPRFGTADADAAHARLSAAGTDADDVLRMEVAPPMFTLRDPDGNLLVLIEDAPG